MQNSAHACMHVIFGRILRKLLYDWPSARELVVGCAVAPYMHLASVDLEDAWLVVVSRLANANPFAAVDGLHHHYAKPVSRSGDVILRTGLGPRPARSYMVAACMGV